MKALRKAARQEGGAIGLLAHNDAEERWTRTRTELLAFLRIVLVHATGIAAAGPAGRSGAGRVGSPRR